MGRLLDRLCCKGSCLLGYFVSDEEKKRFFQHRHLLVNSFALLLVVVGTLLLVDSCALLLVDSAAFLLIDSFRDS